MKYVWSYLIVVLCGTVTSARIMDFLGNKAGFQDNLISDVKDEKVLTPPTASAVIIDSNGNPGNSNEKIIQDTIEELPPFLKTLTALFNQNEMSKYDIIPFSKEDIINMENVAQQNDGKSGYQKPSCTY